MSGVEGSGALNGAGLVPGDAGPFLATGRPPWPEDEKSFGLLLDDFANQPDQNDGISGFRFGRFKRQLGSLLPTAGICVRFVTASLSCALRRFACTCIAFR